MIGAGSPSPGSRRARKVRIAGHPDKAHVSASHVERHNLNMRISMRRFMRLTNAFSKKIDSHIHAPSLCFYRIHKSLRVTPAMASGLSDTVRDMEWIVGLIDGHEEAPKKRGPYKKREKQALIMD